VRAGVPGDPLTYVDTPVRTTSVVIYNEREKATVLTGGSAPFYAALLLTIGRNRKAHWHGGSSAPER